MSSHSASLRRTRTSGPSAIHGTRAPRRAGLRAAPRRRLPPASPRSPSAPTPAGRARPAALCGCFGLKVTHGRIPLDGVFPLAGSVDTVGPLASSIDGLDRSYRALSGDWSEGSHEGLRLGVPEPWVGRPRRTMRSEQHSRRRECARGPRAQTCIEMPACPAGTRAHRCNRRRGGRVHRRFREEGSPTAPTWPRE